jgi:hypothetical protein
MLNPVFDFELGGQKIIYNEISRVVILDIAEPFMSAGKILCWPESFGRPGFGINGDIVKFLAQRKLKLLIRCNMAPQKEYWINYDRLLGFIKEYKPEYLTSGKWLWVIPWRLFAPKPTFQKPYKDISECKDND